MASYSVIPPKLLKELRENLGSDPNQWPQELQDIFDTNIVARPMDAPHSLRVKFFKNPNFAYKWIEDRSGLNPDHTRVESLRAVGWDFATTEDVEMANDFTVKNRKNGKPDGFSNEIRNGDLRMMKLPMLLHRQKRKAENVSAYQMAYPTAYSTTGRAMRAEDLVPGIKTEMVTGEDLPDFESHFRKDNTSVLKVPNP